VLDLPVYDILEKTEETEMKKLGGEIRRQKRNILRIKEDAKIPAGKILLADDVITTGTTMKSAISQIRSKSSHVKGLCIFYHSQKRQSVKQS
jgi:predicted amidophosphoribosyltransferase